jgi:hypothetical protein
MTKTEQTQCSLLETQSQYISMPSVLMDINSQASRVEGDFGDLADLCSGQFQPVDAYVQYSASIACHAHSGNKSKSSLTNAPSPVLREKDSNPRKAVDRGELIESYCTVYTYSLFRLHG